MRSIGRLALGVVAVLSIAACSGGGGSTDRPTTPAAPSGPTAAPASLGADLCGVLTAADWTALGLPAQPAPSVNSQGPEAFYCVWAGTSGATGGLEFDIFVDASVDDAKATYETAKGEGLGAATKSVDIGADEAVAALDSGDADDKFAGLVARKGKVTISVSLPAGADAERQLTTLARAALQRTAALQ